VPLRDDADAPLAMPSDVKIQMQLRSPAASTDVALDMSLDDGRISFVDRDAANIKIEVPASAMRNVAAGSYDHDIIVTYPSGRVIRAVAGIVTVAQGVTR
jgi:hypothetical protein